MEEPAFRREAGTLAGLNILDLGCGDGTFAAECAAAGCATYVGVDGSARMIDRAEQAAASQPVRFELSDIEDYAPTANSFDLVVARLSLHYVRELRTVLERCKQATRAGGRLIFSVVHPVITSNHDEAAGPRTAVAVDSYFDEGDRRRQWIGKPVIWQHRTVEHYVDAVLAAGYRLDALRECAPIEDLFAGDDAEYERRLRVPLFLLIAASLDV